MRLFLVICLPCFALGQVYVAGLGGAAALSNAAAASNAPVAASNYDSKIGPVFSAADGYHFTDWISAQAAYTWNRNRVTATEVTSAAFRQSLRDVRQDALDADLLVYFRPRTSRIRPYLSAGPGWVRVQATNHLGLRVAVGADLMLKKGWGLRYSFSEMMSANPIATGLRPPAGGKLMNFQNLFGVVKVF